ncbi:MAG: chemotaxis protein CheD [Planctomycetes bacterium]|nr:chemotaxis protein CheD [Planctomycetota bacterium]
MNDYMPDDLGPSAEKRLRPGEFCASGQPGICLSTRGLGSSVAVGIYDPHTHVVGLAHVMYAQSSDARAQKDPGFFADTAVSQLFQEMQELGSKLHHSTCIVSIVGGGGMLGKLRSFAIGGTVVASVKKQLSEFGVVPVAEDVSGFVNRSFSIWSDSGDMCVGVNGQHIKLV